MEQDHVQPTNIMPFADGWFADVDKLAASKVGFDHATWRCWIYEKADQNGLFVTGAVCPPKLSGPEKGHPNFRKCVSNTKRKVFISVEELEAIPAY